MPEGYKVEGYRIVEEIDGKKTGGSLGNSGTSENYPAMSKALAEKKVLEQFQLTGATYVLQLIRDARFVEQLTHTVVDNGPEKSHHYT